MKKTNEPSKKLFLWELYGFFFIVTVGSVLHFTFEWSGNSPIVGLISAVNESTWEHLKLAFFPTPFFAVFEYFFVKKIAGNYLIAKTVSLYAMPIAITAIFYLYRLFIPDNLFMDIADFIGAVAIGQFIGHKFMNAGEFSSKWKWTALIALGIVMGMFLAFTYFPPHVELFRNPLTGGYGIG